jgi:hypothetical protein
MLVVTPQFATGAGIVIAAMMAVDVPHAALTYGPNPPVRECGAHACATARPAPGGLATSKPSIKFKPARPKPQPAVMTVGTAGRSRPPVTIEYRVVRTLRSGFVAMITIKSRRKLADWTLTFSFAAARVEHVWGAKWQPDGNGDGGVATGRPWPWPGQQAGSARIVIFATGTPARPASCGFDGASCSYSYS